MTKDLKKFFWLDMEMTGLDESVDKILEVAIIVTDLDFKPIDELHRIVKQSQSVLDGMNEWCQKTHGASGLTKSCLSGTPLDDVENDVVALIEKHYKSDDRVVLCGNSIENDRRFVDKHMPKFSGRLHYRMINVSSFKEVFRDKYDLKFKKGDAHRALDDIHESIKELQYYLSFIKIG